jgi:hypothetical protein
VGTTEGASCYPALFCGTQGGTLDDTGDDAGTAGARATSGGGVGGWDGAGSPLVTTQAAVLSGEDSMTADHLQALSLTGRMGGMGVSLSSTILSGSTVSLGVSLSSLWLLVLQGDRLTAREH